MSFYSEIVTKSLTKGGVLIVGDSDVDINKFNPNFLTKVSRGGGAGEGRGVWEELEEKVKVMVA